MNREKMEMKEFAEIIKRELEGEMGPGSKITVKEVSKNNGVVLTGVCVSAEGKKLCPTIYLEDYLERFNEGECLKEIIGQVKDLVLKDTGVSFDADEFTDWEMAKARICFKIVNFGLNEKMLEGVPHFRFLDLAIVFYYKISFGIEQGNASIMINNMHMNSWNVDRDELRRVAFDNNLRLNPPIISSMYSVIRAIVMDQLEGDGEEKEKRADKIVGTMTDDRCPLYVLTNKEKYFGAACMLYPDTLRDFADKCGNNLIILPSSVHELIIFEATPSYDVDSLKMMVTDVNATQVEREERLSDQVYYYDRKSDRVCLAEDRVNVLMEAG